MNSYIILSLYNGLLESKPILFGGHLPPCYSVPVLPNLQILDVFRFMENSNEVYLQNKPKILNFYKTATYRHIKPGLTACVYELGYDNL